MKKLFIALVALMTLVGCQKEGENSLVGTKWETDGFGPIMESIWGYKYHVYEFTDAKNVDSYWLDRNGKLTSFDGTCKYTIEEPYVIITHDDDDVRKLERINKMTMVATTNTSIKYLKQ